MHKAQTIYALGIVAHPDDESYLMAGSALLFAKDRKKFGLICATKGEKGSSKLPEPLNEDQVGQIREQELREAGKIFQTSFIDCLSYPDGSLNQQNSEKLIAYLTARIDQYQPQIVITFGPEGVSGHKDHKAIGQAAVSASQHAHCPPREVWLLSRPASQINLWNDYMEKMRVHHAHFQAEKLKGVADKKLLVLDTSSVRDLKLQCIYCHKSQGRPGWIEHNLPELEESLLNYEYFEILPINSN